MYIVVFSDFSIHGNPTKLLGACNFMISNTDIVLLDGGY